ncbi:FMRF-Like Peptide [Caenorhabditis elegans]|uniref:FMRF-Like Peptide n=1 Tax=Caenorhabditis elegans TaxID=6239 RepID=O62210_CAEEL|nr:FMRF-Like Peptide [Caenorhabditis elegans]CAB04252.1 FMRF-Like Peptide [Caenorhabditis elegans]|eukprot:NP_506311.1 Uncharacterized protein CELE_F32H5.3 [Caenorhabditis elegans]
MVSITYILLISTVTVLTVSAAPIVTEQKAFPDIAEFSNSNKDANVFLPFRELPERLIDDFNSKELDEGRDLPSESDIFYFFGKTPVLTEVIDARKRGGF